MNRKLPKPVFDALGRPSGSAHPSADLLAAFAEQALPARETDAVTAHLAQCGECRETVFLAAQAVEEDEAVRHPERDALRLPWLRPAAREAAMARAPLAASPQPAAQMTRLTMKPGVDRTPLPRKWRTLTWATPLVAALVIAAAFIVHDRSRVAEVRENIAYQIANNKAGAEEYARMSGKAAPAPEPQSVPPSATAAMKAAPGATALTEQQRQALVAEKQKKLEEYRQQAEQNSGKNDTLALAYREPGQQAMEEVPPPPGANAASSAGLQPNAVQLPPPGTPTQSASLSAAPPPATSPPPGAQPAGATGGSRGLAGSMLARKATATSNNSMKVAADRNADANLESAQLQPPEIDWRISREGHLEVSIVSGVWRRMLADQPTTFHVVAVLSRKEVWAGGDGGALFHSTDGGQHFKKVEVAGLAAKATVISIQFDDAQHGVVGTEDGGRWRTTDGGATWTKL
jgi:hypothetical protein